MHAEEPRRQASPAQIRANQANSRRSTGPKTKAGKEAARRNAVTHGQAGKGVCLAPEDEARRQDRLVAWADSLNPDGEMQLDLLNLAVTNFVRLEGSLRQEAAETAERTRHAEGDWAERRAAEVADLGRRLLDGDPNALRRLRRTSAGCVWLHDAWGPLEFALEAVGRWDGPQLGLALALLGMKDGDPLTGDLAEGLRRWNDHPPGPANDPTAIEARRALRAMVADTRDDLVAEVARLELEIDGPSRAGAADRARLDLSPTGALRLRYLTANDQAMHRALRALREAQETAASRPAPEREPDTFVQTAARGTWLHVPQGWDGPRLARLLDRAHEADRRDDRQPELAIPRDGTEPEAEDDRRDDRQPESPLRNEANGVSRSEEPISGHSDAAPSLSTAPEPATPEPASRAEEATPSMGDGIETVPSFAEVARAEGPGSDGGLAPSDPVAADRAGSPLRNEANGVTHFVKTASSQPAGDDLAEGRGRDPGDSPGRLDPTGEGLAGSATRLDPGLLPRRPGP